MTDQHPGPGHPRLGACVLCIALRPFSRLGVCVCVHALADARVPWLLRRGGASAAAPQRVAAVVGADPSAVRHVVTRPRGTAIPPHPGLPTVLTLAAGNGDGGKSAGKLLPTLLRASAVSLFAPCVVCTVLAPGRRAEVVGGVAADFNNANPVCVPPPPCRHALHVHLHVRRRCRSPPSTPPCQQCDERQR